MENFALTDYTEAWAAGSTLSAERKSAIAAKLSAYTGLPVDYILRANLRVNGGEFGKNLLGSDTITGRLDTRFAGPTLDPLSKESEYDPQSAAISSAYVSAFNDYVRVTLNSATNRPTSRRPTWGTAGISGTLRRAWTRRFPVPPTSWSIWRWR